MNIKYCTVHYLDEDGKKRAKRLELAGAGQQADIVVADTLRLGLQLEYPEGRVMHIPPGRITGVEYSRDGRG